MSAPEAPQQRHTGSVAPSWKKFLLLLVILLVIPLIPLLFLPAVWEASLSGWLRQHHNPSMILLATCGLLAIDILLPVPSSGLITYAGAQVGLLPLLIFATLGLTIGNSLGFELARWGGSRLLHRMVHPDDISRLQQSVARLGMGTLIWTRPLPLLSEAAVLLMGTLKFPRSRFYVTTLCCNFLIVLLFAGFGSLIEDADQLAIGIGLSLLLPLLITGLIRRGKQAEFDEG